MSSNDAAAEVDVISLDEDASSDAVGHRPSDDIWSLLNKKKLPAEVAANYFISDHSINAEIDFDHIAFSNPGVTSKAPLARAVLGSSTQRLDIDSLISHD